MTGACCRLGAYYAGAAPRTVDALERYGLWAGGWMTLARLLRCQPFGTSGIDLVPDTAPPGARWFLPWRYGRWRGVNAPP